MFCTQCGKELRPGLKFCTQCGALIKTAGDGGIIVTSQAKTA